MEERIIDEEYGRGIRMKKTKDGEVDVTDATVPETEEETGEEALFEFPDLEEDDEELATLTPEEALELKRRRAEEAKKRAEEYDVLMKEGEALTQAGEYKTAVEKYKKATELTPEPTEAIVGYWRARTAGYTDAAVLFEAYRDDDFEEFVGDVGEEAALEIKEGLKEVVAKRLETLKIEGEPLEKEIGEKQEARRAVIQKRLSSARLWFFATAVPALVTLILTVYFGVSINTRPDRLFVWVTIGCAVGFLATFIAFCAAANKYYNARRINRKNERLSSTEEGKKLLAIRAERAFFEALISFEPEEVELPEEFADEE